MSSYSSLEARMTELTHQLKQKDAELDQELDEVIQADEEELDQQLDDIDRDIETTNKDLREGLRQRVEAVKKAPKDRARKEAEDALNRMQEDLSKEDLESAQIQRWIASQWLKAS